MFWHNFKYAGKMLIKGKDTLFWTILFPIALFTFMYMAFGNIMEKDEMFKDIPVAVVRDGENDTALMMVLSTLSMDGEDKRIDMEVLNEKEALQKLNDEEVTGVIYTSDASLTVRQSDIKESILESILNQYKQMEQMYLNLMQKDPEAASEIIQKAVQSDAVYYEEISTTDGCQNEYYNYFYAVLAMSCLFSSFAGITRMHKLQANESALGMRRFLSPNPKLVIVLAEYLALLLVQFTAEVITVIYMRLFGVQFGTKYPAILLVLFIACNIGIAGGMLLGSWSKCSYGGKIGIAVAASLTFSFMADLMVHGIKNSIEDKLPILNRINPAVLVTDCLYALNVYDNYDRYFRNILILTGMAVCLLGASILVLRRNKYASV